MSNSATAVTGVQDKSVEPTVTFQDKVNEATNSLTRDDKGHWVAPEGVEMDEAIKFAAISEARRRAAQSKLAKTTSELSIEKEKTNSLTKIVKDSSSIKLTAEEQTELDDLKFEDPEAWRIKMNELENNVATTTANTLSSIEEDAAKKGSIGDRNVILSNFLQDNPEISITQEVIDNDIPPRITGKLERGEVTFLEFLTEVGSYLKTGKVVYQTPGSDDPNLTKAGGSDTPSTAASTAEAEISYNDAIF